MVSPVDQTFPLTALEVRVTLCPWQKVVGPEAEIVGVEGSGFTVNTTGADSVVHPEPSVTETVYEPEVLTIIEGVVAPVDQTIPLVTSEVRVTEEPSQKVVGPEGVIIAATGPGVTVTVIGCELVEHPLTVTETV